MIRVPYHPHQLRARSFTPSFVHHQRSGGSGLSGGECGTCALGAAGVQDSARTSEGSSRNLRGSRTVPPSNASPRRSVSSVPVSIPVPVTFGITSVPDSSRPRSRPRPHLYPVRASRPGLGRRKSPEAPPPRRPRSHAPSPSPREPSRGTRRVDAPTIAAMTTATTCPNTRVAPRRLAPRRVGARRAFASGENTAASSGRKTPSTFGGEAPSARFEPGSSSIPKARDDGKTTVLSNARSPRSPVPPRVVARDGVASTPSDPTSRAPSRRNAGLAPRAPRASPPRRYRTRACPGTSPSSRRTRVIVDQSIASDSSDSSDVSRSRPHNTHPTSAAMTTGATRAFSRNRRRGGMCALAHAVMFGWHAFGRPAYAAGSTIGARRPRRSTLGVSPPRHTPIATPPPLRPPRKVHRARFVRGTPRVRSTSPPCRGRWRTALVAAQTRRPRRRVAEGGVHASHRGGGRLGRRAVRARSRPVPRVQGVEIGRVCAFGSAAAGPSTRRRRRGRRRGRSRHGGRHSVGRTPRISTSEPGRRRRGSRVRRVAR